MNAEYVRTVQLLLAVAPACAFVTLTGTEGKQEIRVLASAFSETLAPEEVVAEALARAVAAIDIRQQPAKAP